MDRSEVKRPLIMELIGHTRSENQPIGGPHGKSEKKLNNTRKAFSPTS